MKGIETATQKNSFFNISLEQKKEDNEPKIFEKEENKKVKEINVFGPLFRSLQTETAKSMLRLLAKGKAIPLFPTKEKPFLKNYLHYEEENDIQKSKIFWKAVDTSSPVFQETNSRIFETSETTIEQTIVFDEMQDRRIIGNAVAAKGAANLEIINLFKEPFNAQKRLNGLKALDQKYFNNAMCNF